ncbi:MAG: Co2+/Mg2+ efflux protein ApaG [Planctomycetota bacterium]
MMAGSMLAGLCKGSDVVTGGVRVSVSPAYESWQPSLSLSASATAGHHVFSYRVRIVNESDRRTRLLRRRWVIIDSDGVESIVEGDGVVGDQPVLEAGEAYEYSSWCRLETDWGTMEGGYEMESETGEVLRVAIGRFYLVADPRS